MAAKSTNFGSRDLEERSSEEDEIFQIIEGGGLMYTTTLTGDPWYRGSPWGTKILKSVKIYVMLFSKLV